MSSRFRIGVLVATALASAPLLGDTFYLLDNGNDSLLRGTVANPAGTVPVGVLASTFWSDLAPSPSAAEVYAVDVDNHRLLRLSTSDAHVVGELDLDRRIRSLACDTAMGTLYGLPMDQPENLYTIDPVTGATTVVGLTGIPEDPIQVFGLCFDPVTHKLYVSSSTTCYALDPANAATTVVGGLSQDTLFDLDYNYGDGELYATNADDLSLYRLDRNSAALTRIGGPYAGANWPTGLAFAIPEPATLTAFVLLAFAQRWAKRR